MDNVPIVIAVALVSHNARPTQISNILWHISTQ
jgi:hypothetical protein